MVQSHFFMGRVSFLSDEYREARTFLNAAHRISEGKAVLLGRIQIRLGGFEAHFHALQRHVQFQLLLSLIHI